MGDSHSQVPEIDRVAATTTKTYKTLSDMSRRSKMKHNPEVDLVADDQLGAVAGEVLKLWSKVPEFQEKYELLMTENVKYHGTQCPRGYVPIDSKTKIAEPVKLQLVALVIMLSKNKFEKRYSLAEGVELLKSHGISFTRMGLTRALERIAKKLGVFHLIPKGKKVTIESLADAEALVQRERKAYAKRAVKEKKSPEEIKADLAPKNSTSQKSEKSPEIEEEDLPEDFKGREVIYQPTEKQIVFHAASEKIVLYGGAAGGGKSFALLFDVIRYAHVPGYKGLIIRRTMAELTELIETSKEYYPKLFPGAKYNTQKTTWRFPSGAMVIFGYLDKPNDKLRYQGQQYQYIAFDELGQWQDAEGWNYLKSRLRNPPVDPLTGKKIPTLMRATSNPGARWVKEMFIDAAEPNTTFYDRAGISHRFIPATLLDNPHLDEDYRQMLLSLPEIERRQLLFGDWTATDLAAFPEFTPETHVVPPFEIPGWWNRICGMDYGYRDPASAIWIAIHPETGQKIIYREFSETGLTGAEFARCIMQIELVERIPVEHIIDWTIFNKTGYTGPTIGEQIQRAGVALRRADRNRIAGNVQIHEHLRANVTSGEPELIIFDTCTEIVQQLSSAQIDEKNPDDINQKRIGAGNKRHHWDLYDCLRYALMARPTRHNRRLEFNQIKQRNRWNTVNDYFSD